MVTEEMVDAAPSKQNPPDAKPPHERTRRTLLDKE